MKERSDEAVARSTDDSDKREEAKKALHSVIVTALDNCSEEAKIDPASYPIKRINHQTPGASAQIKSGTTTVPRTPQLFPLKMRFNQIL